MHKNLPILTSDAGTKVASSIWVPLFGDIFRITGNFKESRGAGTPSRHDIRLRVDHVAIRTAVPYCSLSNFKYPSVPNPSGPSQRLIQDYLTRFNNQLVNNQLD